MLKTTLFLIFGTLALLFLPSCNRAKDDKMDAIHKIEKNVKLPKNARSLGEYSRFYYFENKSHIIAIYLEQNQKQKEQIKKECKSNKIIYYPCNDPNFGIISPDSIKIVENLIELPIQSGGGCNYVEIKYDIMNDEFLMIECNGSH